MNVPIETGIALPVRYLKYEVYPYKQLTVGQSFVADMADGFDINLLRQALSQYARRHGKKMKFITRKIGPTQWRIWRTV